jgi:hypothetical protein
VNRPQAARTVAEAVIAVGNRRQPPPAPDVGTVQVAVGDPSTPTIGPTWRRPDYLFVNGKMSWY